ncbi:MAG: N-terminal beta barrel domain, partial [Pseudonocardiales bacterium]|nr:N-terminal beta barrel domain [Pseudonocardiales bacterium]
MGTGRIGTIVGLWRFPVKSMLGERVETADITDVGIVGDR